MCGKDLDLYVLYHEVCKNGGVVAVIRDKLWKKVSYSSMSILADCAHILSLSTGCVDTLNRSKCHDSQSKRLALL